MPPGNVFSKRPAAQNASKTHSCTRASKLAYGGGGGPNRRGRRADCLHAGVAPHPCVNPPCKVLA
eukprot:10738872-Lingulodinium_polyedra.AAC.1